MSISALRFSSSLLRLPHASSRLLRQDRLPLSTLRCFSTSPPPIPKDNTVSTKPRIASNSLTKPKKLAKAINQAASQETPRKPRPLQVVVKDEIHTTTCMEVFDIRIQRFDGKRNTRVYGTVEGDGDETITLYDRPITNPESVHLGFSPLLLTGQEYPFTFSDPDPFGIKIDIKDADTDRDIIRGDLDYISRDLDYMPRHSGPGRGYDKFIQEEVLGPHGSALVSYALFYNGVAATVEVTLVDGGADVCGGVAASNTFMSQGQSVLFFHGEKEEQEKKVSVGPGGRVTLSRSVVSQPKGSDLNVRVELWDRDGEEIANATATFQHRLSWRTSTKVIPGKIQVKVTWEYCGMELLGPLEVL